MDRGNEHEEIDIVSRIVSGKVKYDLFCECKFTKKPMGRRDLETLRRRAGRFDGNGLLILFSVSGFDDEILEAAEGQNILLAGPEVIFGYTPFPELPGPSD